MFWPGIRWDWKEEELWSGNNIFSPSLVCTINVYTLRHLECLVLVTGNFNPTSTNIAPTPFKRSRGLTQIINVLTRDSGILDWCLTNKPKALCAPSQLPKLGSSDHYCVPIKQGPRGKTTKRTITRRDTRASCIRAFGSWITTFSWYTLCAGFV